jgi:23S rRNA (cytosine1962-C5)-methyltransferase
VLQTLTLAMDKHKSLIADAIKTVLNPRSIIERNDTLARVPEGMKQEKSVLHGTAPEPFEVRVGKVRLLVDLMEGQKTGLYLDQLSNYEKVAALAKGRRVLDCFTNQGGFAQACALDGARDVTAVDTSEPAIALARRNSESSGAKVNYIAANAFDVLKQSAAEGEIYDMVILDPPSFTKTKSSVADALRGYKEIALRAIGMLEPGGVLVIFSCSHNITGGDLRNVIASAAVDAKRALRRRAVYSQREDHPVIAGIPETEYLRGYAMEVMGSW